MTPPMPCARADLLAYFEAHRDAVTTEHGGEIWRGFLFDADRYRFDLALQGRAGWRQYDTDQDAGYFGVWVHTGDWVVVTFAEGDLSVWVADDAEAFRVELARMAEFYGAAPPVARIITGDGALVEVFGDRPGDEG